MIPVSLFAFAATSYISQFSFQNRYVLPITEAVLAASIDSLRMGPYRREPTRGDTVTVYVPVQDCFGSGSINAQLVVRGAADSTDVELTQLTSGCRTSRDMLLRLFEHCFVARLDSAAASRASRPVQPRALTPRLGKGKPVACAGQP